MRGGFYVKLAGTGITKNRKLYFPYILTCICMVMMFYIVLFLAVSKEFRSLPGGASLQTFLGFGVIVIAVFSLIFLYYTNSFLIRRRQREFGLYNILGMGKRNLVKILIWENILTAIVSLVLGLACGILFSKLGEMIAAKLLGGNAGFSMTVNPWVAAVTAVLFAGIFFLIMLRMLFSIYRSRPVEMLRSENVGEKPPKANWILALAGTVILAGAYYLAVTIEDVLTAAFLFFVAVVMVIIATYLLFVAGSVALCRLLQKNKNYYYKTKHFVSLSSLVYRMKRNGAGLASICILSTMVLVTVSSTVCLYAGTEQSIKLRYPRDITVETYSMDRGKYISPLKDAIGSVLEEHGLTAENVLNYRYLGTSGYQKEDTIYFDTSAAIGEGVNVLSGIRSIYVIPVEDYNASTGEDLSLAEDEIALYGLRAEYGYDTITLENCGTWKIKEVLDSFIPMGGDVAAVTSTYYILVKDLSVMEKIEAGQGEVYGEERMSHSCEFYGFNLDCPDEEKITVGREIEKTVETLQAEWKERDGDRPIVYTESRAAERAGYYGLTGGMLFLGILLGAVFLFGTVLIMYYKQISEGYEDQDRFDILMKVGMSRKEVRQSINSQVLTIFFLPLIIAGIHLIFAFPLISKILMLLLSTERMLLIFVAAACYVVFALFYVLVYLVTSREYYKIVSGKER